MTSPFLKKQKRKNRRNASVIGFANADFCSEKGDVPNEEIKYHMLVKDNLKKKRKMKKEKAPGVDTSTFRSWGEAQSIALSKQP